ncbi:MAG: hypothetical protein R3Y51_01220 [Rikenellaceae bacterium]
MRYLFIFIMLLSYFSINAQPQRIGAIGVGTQMRPLPVNAPERPGVIPPPIKQLEQDAKARSTIINLYIASITKRLNLDTKTSKQVATIFTEYYNEVANLPIVTIDIEGDATDDELEAQLFSSLNNIDYTTAIKRKYYPEFRKILTVRQILMMYDVEREFYERITLESIRRKENTTP